MINVIGRLGEKLFVEAEKKNLFWKDWKPGMK